MTKDVLKYSFYYYLGTAKPTDQKKATIIKVVCYTHRSHGERAHPAMGTTQGCTGASRGQREQRRIRARVFIVVPIGKMGESE